ncbi:hypothetical protein [Pyrobaculum aerophilum]|nr:hypothetical protein [Pyrobaculum aerophilum]HII48120.1 hypothetical protein [Pyrobaculum aerophilum]
MPTKLKGMTSLEIAIIVAIVLVIAIAVGWYLYTTFASAGQQASLTVVTGNITKKTSSITLYLRVIPQGGASVQIQAIEIAGKSITAIKVNNETTNIVTGPAWVTADLTKQVDVAVGQVLTGRVVLSNGAVAPFTVSVLAG